MQETIKCTCGHEVKSEEVMSGVGFTSCPECYEKMWEKSEEKNQNA